METLETLKAKILKLSLEFKEIRASFKNINKVAKSEEEPQVLLVQLHIQEFIPSTLRILNSKNQTVGKVYTNKDCNDWAESIVLSASDFNLLKEQESHSFKAVAYKIDKDPKICKVVSFLLLPNTSGVKIFVKLALKNKTEPKIIDKLNYDSEAIFIAFPDYKIETPLGYFSGLGHAGLSLIDPKGKTIYYEYGRYDKEQLGLVKVLKKPLPNVVIANDGLATKESLKIVLKEISTQAGKKGRIEAIYFKQTNFEKMNAYAQKRMNQNKNPKRDPYELTSNNCGTFAQDVIKQSPNSNTLSESEMPYIQSPVNLVKELDKKHQRIDYNPKDNKIQIEDEK